MHILIYTMIELSSTKCLYILSKIGSTDTGRKSLLFAGLLCFGMGLMRDVFQEDGNLFSVIRVFMIRVKGETI